MKIYWMSSTLKDKTSKCKQGRQVDKSNLEKHNYNIISIPVFQYSEINVEYTVQSNYLDKIETR